DDLGDKDPEPNKKKPRQPRQDLPVVASAEQQLQRKTGCEQEKDAGSQEIGSDIDQAEIRSAHRPSCCVTTVATHPERYGSRTCWRPFSLRSFNELAVPLDCRTTYVSFVPVGPAKLNPEVGSEAPILTDGRPRSVISRRSTVSDCSSPEEDLLAGRTVIL